jgi:four helix bundle protein
VSAEVVGGDWLAMPIESHRDLLVWQKAMDLVTEVYAISRAFPKDEQYGLTSQLRRAVVSIPANIAEGRARGTSKDFANFVAIAKGSLMESETLLMIAVRLGFTSIPVAEPVLAHITELSKMLTALRNKLVK